MNLSPSEKALVLKALRALKAHTEPTSPEWGAINRLWDRIVLPQPRPLVEQRPYGSYQGEG